MKKSTKVTVFGLLMTAFFVTTSCNKKALPNTKIVNDSTRQMLLSYMIQKKSIDPETSLFIDTLICKSDWTNSSQSIISNLTTLFYVPLNYTKNKSGVIFMYNNYTKKYIKALLQNFQDIKNIANK